MKRDFEDVQYLLTNFGTEVSQVWRQLNQEEVDRLLELDWMVEAPPAWMEYYRRVLGR